MLLVVGTCGRMARACGASARLAKATSQAPASTPVPPPAVPSRSGTGLGADALNLDREGFMKRCQEAWDTPFECGCITATVYDELGSQTRQKLLSGQISSAEQAEVDRIASRNCGRPTHLYIQKFRR
jgi:hypothetical protein